MSTKKYHVHVNDLGTIHSEFTSTVWSEVLAEGRRLGAANARQRYAAVFCHEDNHDCDGEDYSDALTDEEREEFSDAVWEGQLSAGKVAS